MYLMKPELKEQEWYLSPELFQAISYDGRQYVYAHREYHIMLVKFHWELSGSFTLVLI